MSKTSRTAILILAALLFVNCAAAFPVTVTDYYGENITINEKPQRIISLMPSNTEILFAVGAADQVVGVTDHCNYPAEAQNVTKIGGYVTLDAEKIVDLKPDLVLAYEANGEEAISYLKKLGLTVVTLDSTTMEDIEDNIQLVGNITGHDEEAKTIVSDMQSRTEKILSQTKDMDNSSRPRVLFIVSFDPMYAAGNGSFPDNLITIAGGSNIVEASAWPTVSLEDVVQQNPQIIICTGMGERGIKFREQIMNSTVLSVTDAVQNNKVYAILEPNIIERPGPRVIEGLEQIYSFISPELQLSSVPASDNVTDTEKLKAAPSSENTTQNNPAPTQENTPKTPGFGIVLAACMVISACIIKASKK